VVYAQSHGTWWSAEFRARAVEGRYAVLRGDLTWADVDRALVREFPQEVKECGTPSEQRIREWAKARPDLPETMRKKGFLTGLEPLEYQPGAMAGHPAVPAQPLAMTEWGVALCPTPQPTSGVQGSFPVFGALVDYMMYCMLLTLVAAAGRMVLSSL